MLRKSLVFLAIGCLVGAAVPRPSEARVVRFVVEQRRAFAPGTEWGTAGAYERLDGTAYFEVDPRDPQNAVIVNLDKAPRNTRGLVEFSSPFYILKPADLARGNHKLWYGVNNRGNSIEITLRGFPIVAGSDPLSAGAVGENNILLHKGYAFVDAGWHGDGIPRPNALFPNFPVAGQPDGSSIVGPLRLEYQTAVATFTQPLAPGWKPYEAADTNTLHSTLTVRDRADAPKVPIPADRWAFGRCPSGPGSLVPTTTDLCLFDGFEARKIYELIYPAKNPIVMGLAYAVTRDVGAFLRYQTHDDAGNPNPLALSSTNVGLRRAYLSGTSSTGMYMREFLYLGFNEDEAQRKVFDGVTILTAATHRLFANVQFAHPTFYSRQDRNQDYTSNSYPPFTFAVTTDPISGIHDGILKRPATDPLVMQIDGELEVWQWKASLNVHDAHGRSVRIPDNVRLYYLSGFGHVGGITGVLSPPRPPGTCQHLLTGSLSAPTPRALVLAMDDWADRGIHPPKSNYPRLEDKALVSLEEYRAAFPRIPGVEPPAVINEIHLLNFGPFFDSEGGEQTLLPPLRGPRYPVFAARSDRDGLNIAGILPLEMRVPLGTNTGWNVQAGFRAPDLCGLSGAYFPFAETKAERLANGDPRKSLEERYKDHEGFVKAVKKAAKKLVKEGFLLEEDAETYIRAAEASDVLR